MDNNKLNPTRAKPMAEVGLQVVSDADSVGLCVTRFDNYIRKRTTEVIVLDSDTAANLASELNNALENMSCTRTDS